MTDITFLAQEALNILVEFGTDAVFTAFTTGAYDPAQGKAPVTQVVTNVKCTIEAYGRILLESGLVDSSDRKITVAALSLPAELNNGDEIVSQGHSYSTVRVDIEYAQDVPVIYTIQGRRK